MNQVSTASIIRRAAFLACSPRQWKQAIIEMDHPLLFEFIVLLILQFASWFVLFNNGHFTIAPDVSQIGLLSLFAGITSIISVVFDSSGNIANFLFGALNNVAYIYVSFQSHLYGEVYLNLYFLVSQFIGAYVWMKRNLNHDVQSESEVQVRELSAKGWVGLTILVLIGWLLLGLFLKQVPFITPTLDPHPWIDSLSVVVQIFAQLLLVFRYGNSQFILWIIGNAAEVALWTINFNPIFIVLFFGCLVNAFFGMYVWNKKRQQQG